MHAATEVVGMMASLTSFLIWLPQGARVWRHRHEPEHLRGIVRSTQVISLCGSVLWGVYAVLIGSFWLGAPSLVNGPIAIATLVVVGRARQAGATAAHGTRTRSAEVPTVASRTAEPRAVAPRTAELPTVGPRTVELPTVGDLATAA